MDVIEIVVLVDSDLEYVSHCVPSRISGTKVFSSVIVPSILVTVFTLGTRTMNFGQPKMSLLFPIYFL